jgi:hypothetical protein
MSGFKRATVTISEEEYRRLHQADMKKRFGRHGKAREQELSIRQAAELTDMLYEMENRQKGLERALGDINQDFSRAETETMQGILLQNALCYENLMGIMEQTTAETNQSLALARQQFAQRMQEEREQHRRGMNELMQRLNAYKEKEHAKEDLARQWLKRSVMLADFIRDRFDHERFIPGRLSKLLNSLDFAQSNLAQGLPESSLQTSQQTFLDLSELHFELEQRVLEWQTEYKSTAQELHTFLSDVLHNTNVPAFDLEGHELPEQVDLDYWTTGKYQKLLKTCREVLFLLEQDEKEISSEDLKRIQAEVIPAIKDYFESIVYEARLNALNSQLRMNIADTALRALEEYGFRLNDSGYSNEDMRASFTAKLEGRDGSEVMIEVLPTENQTQEFANDLVVITRHPYLKTELAARSQWDELCRVFEKYGLKISDPEVQPAPPQETPQHTNPQTSTDQQLIIAENKNDVQ